MLSHRARRILLAAVGDFIATGEPVASKALTRLHELEMSPATVRSVFAELEGGGYLTKPHASAGRVPTDKGLRVFAEAMIAVAEGQSLGDDTAASAALWAAHDPGFDAALRHTTRVLAMLSGSAALLRPPPGESWVLRDLKFIALRPREVLAVVVATNGAVENRVLAVEETLSPADLERANNMIHAKVQGMTLAQVRATLAQELEAGRAGRDRLERAALALGQQALAALDSPSEVLVEGAAQLIARPEFASAETTRQLVIALEDQELLLDLLDRTMAARGLQVLFGGLDNTMGSDLSLVATSFGAGAIGVIGSTRMDYGQVAPLVRQAATQLADVLGGRTSKN
jgi:heat-inducible transcriptional repressor